MKYHSSGNFYEILFIVLFLIISGCSDPKGGNGEKPNILFIALDVGYIDDACFNRLQSKAAETSRVIGGLRAAIHKRKEKK